MTERYDAVEREMGILSYATSINDNPGFAAVLKVRYSDFLVHEVGTNGKVARLTSLENNLAEPASTAEASSSQQSETKKRNADEGKVDRDTSEIKKVKMDEAPSANNINADANNPNPTTNAIAQEPKDMEATLLEIQSKLTALVGDEAAKGATAMLRQWESFPQVSSSSPSPVSSPSPPPKGTDDDSKHYTFPLIEEKLTRKAIHMLIKSDLFKGVCMADTIDKRVRIWHKLFETQMPNHGLFVKDARFQNRPKKVKMEWPQARPNFIKFVLYKENIDTGTAAKDVSRTLRLPPKQRGGRMMNDPGSGGLGYAGMKDKRGCTAQFCTLFRKTPEDVLVLNKEKKNDRRQGGGNSKFGGSTVMRVGNFSYVDRELRLGQLSGNRFDIVLRNVCIAGCSTEAPQEERLKLITSTLKRAATLLKETGFINYFGMQRFGKFHDTHLVGVAVLKGDFEKACDIIMRTKEKENEQSVSTRNKWSNRFDGINVEDHDAVREAEMKCAKIVMRELGRFMNCETSIVSSLSRNPLDYKKAFGSISKHMRSMFLHAYQSYIWNKAASHRIGMAIADGSDKEVRVGDLVLVEDKGLEDGGNGTSGLKGKAVKEVSQDDVEMCKYSITDVVLPLAGSKIEYPSDSTGDVYEDLLANDGLTKESFDNVLDRELAVGGDYRKVMCKPHDVDFEIKLYNDPTQPLVKTDLMEVTNASLDCVDVTADENERLAEKSKDQMIVGMVIGFTLPPSAYATIALRELTRRPTSAQYQTELLLEGDCEANLGKSS